jgi:hypothetical protein
MFAADAWLLAFQRGAELGRLIVTTCRDSAVQNHESAVPWLAHCHRLTFALVFGAVVGCHSRGSESHRQIPSETPRERYFSTDPFRLVIVHGRIYLKFTGNDSEPSGPFERISDNIYEYRDNVRGTQTICQVSPWTHRNSCARIALRECRRRPNDVSTLWGRCRRKPAGASAEVIDRGAQRHGRTAEGSREPSAART